MQYRLDPEKFQKRLAEFGVAGLSAFAQKTGLHRNTLQGLLAGKNVFCTAFSKLASALHSDPMDLVSPCSSLPVAVPYIEEIAGIVGQLVHRDSELGVFLLGSRAAGRAKLYSDWDIGISRYPNPLDSQEYLVLKMLVETASEDLVRMVDLVNLDQAPSWFLQSLEHGRLIFLDGNRCVQLYWKGVLDGLSKAQ